MEIETMNDDDEDHAEADGFREEYSKYWLEDLTHLSECASRLREMASELEELTKGGWELNRPVDHGWLHMEKKGNDLLGSPP